MTMIMPNRDKDSFGTISPKSDDRGSPFQTVENDPTPEATNNSKVKQQFAANRSKSQDATKLDGVLNQMVKNEDEKDHESKNMTSLAP